MSTQILLTVPDDVYRQIEKAAAVRQRDVSDLILETISHSFAPFPIHRERVIMEKNIAAYKTMHADLVATFLGETVAILDGNLIDHDLDPVNLLHRLRAQHPGKTILRRKVEPDPEPEIKVRHPRIEPLS